ncbi:hypothetical protein Pst134EB_012443 [Puccinia striiformis f. sp. tritici]|uniref:Uncharacterized protein n=1 Tax=Puccinia striiformis f. sp. tritici PST-78 TaxID=1165861 RepID=A0A0L0VL14_9BASI|nr:hypothetical protein Pst134EB_012443 [Puccinia striiformis f. sp. tritici]KNE99921.1 hypothetical protein PSTG_06775 [Puccinia striiformis f. sp. tritici PST-78]
MGAPARSGVNTSPMSGAKRPSHPMYVMGPFDVIDVAEHSIPPGSSYGQLNYITSIAYNDESEGGTQEDVIVDLSGYGSRNNGLAKDKVYQLAGRFVGPNDGGKPIVFYEQALTLLLGNSTDFITKNNVSLLAGKVGVFGFGVVTHRETVDVTDATNEVVQTNLRVTLRHTDYHTIRRERVEFETTYVIPGNVILRNTFGLLQLGQEALIVGYMGGFDVKKHSWEVHGLLLSMLSGAARLPNTPSATAGASDGCRPGLKRLTSLAAKKGREDGEGSTEEPEPKRRIFDPANVFPTPSTSQTVRSTKGSQEDGQVSDDEGDHRFMNTYPDRPSCLSSGSVKGKEKAGQNARKQSTSLSDAVELLQCLTVGS